MANASDRPETISVQITDPGADDQQIHLWKAPKACEVVSSYFVCKDAQASGSAGAFETQNWGTAGTAVEGTVVATLGGTAVADRISAAVPTQGSITEGTLAEGDWLVLDYQETGDFVEGSVNLVFEVVYGIGA